MYVFSRCFPAAHNGPGPDSGAQKARGGDIPVNKEKQKDKPLAAADKSPPDKPDKPAKSQASVRELFMYT